MKKAVKYTAIVILLLFCSITIFELRQINTSKTPTCFLLSSSNSAMYNDSNINIAEENKWWNGNSFISNDADANLAINFNNSIYNCIYQNSRYDNYNSFATNYYISDDGSLFGINSITKELVYINFKTLLFFEKEPYIPDIDDIDRIGEDIALKYVSTFTDPKDYILFDVYKTPYQPNENEKSKMTLLTYTFVKEINNECSSAYISVQITSKGHLASIVVGDINAFSEENTKKANAFNNVDIDTLVLNKLKTITRNLNSPLFEITKKYYALTPDNEIVICITAKCQYQTNDSNKQTQTESIAFEFIIK